MVGFFNRTPKDPQIKKNLEKFKEFKKLVKEKKYVMAINAGTQYLKHAPNNPDVLFTIGGIYYMQGKYKTAISFFDKSLYIASYDIEVLLLKAYSHKKLGQSEQAIQCCNKIKEIDPKNKAVILLLNDL